MFPVKADTLAPHQNQASKIISDQVSSFAWSQDNTSLALQGNHYFWIWNISNQSLKRVSLNERYSNLLVSKSHYWLLGDTFLRTFDKINLDSKKFDLSQFKEILGASIEGETITIVAKSSLVFINTTDSSITVKKKIETNSPSLYSKESIWSFQKGLELIRDGRQKTILTCPNATLKPRLYKSSILYICDQKIHRFSKLGVLLQIIPIISGSNLKSWYISDDTHAYLFDNNILEFYKPNGSESRKIKLQNSFDSFIIRGSSVIGLSGGLPIVEFFEGQD